MAISSARIHADVVRIDCQASSERMKEVVSLFEQYKTTADTLQIMEQVTFEPEDLNRLIQVLLASMTNNQLIFRR